MGLLRISGDTSGFVDLIAPALAGATILSLPTANGTVLAPATVAINGSILIGNTVSGGFDVTTITQGSGIQLTNGKGSITIAAAGTVTKGTTCTQNTLAASTITTALHGLGQTPTFTDSYLECVSVEAGYLVGDRIYVFADGATARGFSTFANATHSGFASTATASGPFVADKSSGAATNLTLTKWKGVIESFLVNT